MDEDFKLEIISPEKIIFSDSVKMVKVPSYEGDMSILNNHISIITFLRPGLIKVQIKDEKFEEFFVQDGTVEFSNNLLVILSSSILNIKDISKEFLETISKKTQDKLTQQDISDEDRYVLNHQLEVIKDIRI